MAAIPPPGRSEQGFLSDLQAVAERVGSEVLGEAIRWEVEAVTSTSLRRPDVVIRRDATSEALATGEAKRPDQPEGVHPLIQGEVSDALGKADALGVGVCFTTNFFQAAVFDARPGTKTDLDRLQGDLLALVPEDLATAPGWWQALPDAQRDVAVQAGMRQLFERIRASLTSPTLQANISEVTLSVFSRSTDQIVEALFPEILSQRGSGILPANIVDQGLSAHLKVKTSNQDARYLVAQGVAEILTAALFYRNIVDHFSLPGILGGTDPATASALLDRVKKSLKVATQKTGDYETIFLLSPVAEWALISGGQPVLKQWKDLLNFTDQLDFTAVTADVLGTIFERLISPERRRAMGQHYTQARLAESMSKWAVQSEDDLVADVASGAGTFLVSVYGVLAAKGRSHQEILRARR